MKRDIISVGLVLLVISVVLSIIGIWIDVFRFSWYMLLVLVLFFVIILLVRVYEQQGEIIIAFIISLFLIGGIVFASFYFEPDVYVLDVGAEDEVASGVGLLSPADRVSSKKVEYVDGKIMTYRELTSSLVYTNLDVPNSWKGMNLRVTFKRSGDDVHIGVKKGSAWDYKWLKLYESDLNVSSYNVLEEDGLYLYYKGEREYGSVSEFLEFLPTDKSIAYDNDLLSNQPANLSYVSGETFIDATLRGSHSFWIHAKDDLYVDFIKEDMNNYLGDDVFNVSLFSFDGSLISSELIGDDGINDTSSAREIQLVDFYVEDLEEGIYRLELNYLGKGDDSTINSLSINQQRVVFDRKAFPLSEFSFYSEEAFATFQTYHVSAYQDIFLDNGTVSIDSVSKKYPLTLSGEVSIPLGDVIVSSTDVFAVTSEHYFHPFEYNAIPLDNLNVSALSTDFVLVDYGVEGDELLTASLFVENKGLFYEEELSIVFNGRTVNENNTLPLYAIEVEYD